jgi:Family of unknown function (DUF6544)
MAAMLRRLPAVAGLAVLAGADAACPGCPGRAGVVTEDMLADLPEPVRRYLRYTGVAGRPFPGVVRLRQRGTMRVGPGQRWLPLDAEEHYSVRPPPSTPAASRWTRPR